LINVMLVEDEPPVMRLFEKLLSEHGAFSVAAKAINGKRALEELAKQKIDVVFTDIRMPVMDGLELAGELQKSYPESFTVLVSGYQDFEYARKAIQYDVFDYLLKPVSKNDLFALLDKLEVAVNTGLREKKRKNVMNAIRDEQGEATDLREGESFCAVLLICAGAFPLSHDDSMFPSRVFWDQIDRKNIIDETYSSMIFNGKTASEKVVVIELEKDTDPKELIFTIYERLRKDGKLPVTLSSFENTLSINGISEGLRVLRSRLYTGIRFCRSSVLLQEIQAQDLTNDVDIQTLTESVLQALNTENRQNLEQTLYVVLNQLYLAECTQLELVSFLRSIVSAAFSKLSAFESKYLSLNLEIDEAVSGATDIKGLADDIASILFAMKEKKNGQGTEKVPALIREMESFLKENYSQSITNTLLSQKFGFVPSYLSRLFKTYTGTSPSEYLTDFRIAKAKQFMSEKPDLMVKEVAAMVGIGDQYYFSKLFKKGTGQWPTEFRG